MAVMTLDVLTRQQAEREAQRVQANREELVERIAQAIRADGHAQPLKGLHLYRHSVPLEQVYSVVEPSVCVVAQGSKEFLLGESRYRYDPAHYLLSTVELPSVGKVIEASKERPFLSLRLELAPALVGAVMVEAGYSSHASPPGPAEVRAIAVSSVDVDLLDAVVRLVRLLDAPAEAPVLMSLITREIIYRLLMGEQGARLRHLALLGGYTPRITRAIERLQQDFDQPLRIEQMARELGMSVSGLHHHFKAVTAMSPLQYQKRLRLLEARRLMLGEDLDAARAAYRVGYRDASHFNREYKSLFGAPPMRDVQRLRAQDLIATSAMRNDMRNDARIDTDQASTASGR
ncbi:MAG TPA: AraC family transcriptional regulator [Ktedonobacterales bacterium]